MIGTVLMMSLLLWNPSWRPLRFWMFSLWNSSVRAAVVFCHKLLSPVIPLLHIAIFGSQGQNEGSKLFGISVRSRGSNSTESTVCVNGANRWEDETRLQHFVDEMCPLCKVYTGHGRTSYNSTNRCLHSNSFLSGSVNGSAVKKNYHLTLSFQKEERH